MRLFNALGIYYFLFVLIAFISGCSSQINSISLDGEWRVFLDTTKTGFENSVEKTSVVNLPGSLAENQLGIKTVRADTAMLTPTHKYIGAAWYFKTINIPKQWQNKSISLFLERVLWESQVFLDGKKIDTQDALGTPHIHRIGKVAPGEHLLAIRVNNEPIHNIGIKGHSYTEHTQTIWNGIVGRMELQAVNDLHIHSTKVYGDYDNDEILVKLEISGELPDNANMVFEIENIETGKLVLEMERTKDEFISNIKNGIQISLNKKIQAWSEYSPNLYKLHTKINAKNKTIASASINFGLRKVSHDGTKIHVNNTPVFLRGNLDNVHFPLTGYPSCKVEDWERIFKIYKEYGLNHVRFHSWCPPEAAFDAADKLGIYIQAEAGVWIDWWMSNVSGLGKDSIRDIFVKEEMDRVIDIYGNHPSFILFCIGNELGSADFKVLERWIREAKDRDPRRLYAASTARTITNECDYSATHYINNVGLVRGTIKPDNDWDYESVYGPNKIPIIAHEIGQWPVYPQWDEIKKYTGVLKAGNLKVFKEQAKINGIEHQSGDFQKASGALNQLLYKYEIESFLRTPSCAGIQLLGINDYPGQGEALIGWLDSFWDSKNIVTPQKFRQHFSTTVPLLKFKKYVWENSEIFSAKAQVSHHGINHISGAEIAFQIRNSTNEVLHKGVFQNRQINNGTVNDLGEINFPLSSLSKAQKLTISLTVKNTDFNNEWNIWVYPETLPLPVSSEEIVIAEKFNESTINDLNEGKSVLLNASKLGSEQTSVSANFYPLYWSLTYFPGQGKTNIGLLVDNKHAAFEYFPTGFHSNWQWESISKNSKGFIINELSAEYKSIAQPIDDFHRNNKVGSIMEFKVGKGKILICGFDFNNDSLPVARQLKYSLSNYVLSDKFNPDYEIGAEWLQKLFSLHSTPESEKKPKKYANALFYIRASGNKKDDKLTEWKTENDFVVIPTESHYRVTGALQNKGSWIGNNIAIDIDCPKGILGTCLININKIESEKLSVEFEGRIEPVTKSDVPLKLSYHIMREDSQDGKLSIKLTGNGIEINELIINKDE